MDCARCEDLLFEALDGRLDAGDEEALRVHLRACARCRELQALLSEPREGGAAHVEVPDDLLPAVLERTSGALARALARLQHELSELASLDPGGDFVAEVMEATRGLRRPLHAASDAATGTTAAATWWSRLGAAWTRLAQRPRLALEGAYAVALVLFLIVGLPSRSFAELPVRAFGGIRQETARMQQVASSGVDAVLAFGLETWSDSTARLNDYWTTPQAPQASPEAVQLQRGARAWATALRDLAAGIWRNLFAPFADNLRALFRDSADEPPGEPTGEPTGGRAAPRAEARVSHSRTGTVVSSIP